MAPDDLRGCCSINVKLVTMPRYGVSDVAEFWRTERGPMPLDNAALEAIIETVRNNMYDGVLSNYFLQSLSGLCQQSGAHLILDEALLSIRCGRLWSFEYIKPTLHVSAIVFGKAHYASGVCTTTEMQHRMASIIGIASRRGYGPVICVATSILKTVFDLFNNDIDKAIVMFQKTIMEHFSKYMMNPQWCGFICGGLLKDRCDEWDEQMMLRSGHLYMKCVRMQKTIRILGWILEDIYEAHVAPARGTTRKRIKIG